MSSLAVRIDGKKFMWDKGVYTSESEAKEKMTQYEQDGFEATCLNEDGKYLVYSRRVVSEITLD